MSVYQIPQSTFPYGEGPAPSLYTQAFGGDNVLRDQSMSTHTPAPRPPNQAAFTSYYPAGGLLANRTSGTGALGPHSDPARRARQHSCSRPAPAIPAHPAWGPMGRLSRLDAMHFAGHRPAGSVEKGTSLHLETPTPQMVFVLSSYRHASGTLDALADRRCRQGDGASRNFCIICTFRGQINPQALYFILRRPRRYHWLARGCVVHLSWGVAGASPAPATDGPRGAVRAAGRPLHCRHAGRPVDAILRAAVDPA